MIPFNVVADSYGDLKIHPKQINRVYDGDTFFIDVPGWPDIIGSDIGIRVLHIDTPEIRGECEEEKILARAARDRVAELLANAKTIELRDMDRDKYFRIDADVYIDNVQLVSILNAEGLAVRPYDGGTKFSWCE